MHPVADAERAGADQPGHRRPDRHGAGADDQLVVAQQLLPTGAGHQQLAAGHVDPLRGGVQPQHHPGGFQVRYGAVGQVAPVRHLAGDVVGDAADGEVRVAVGGHHGHLGARVHFPRPQRGADAGVAAADRNQMHDCLPFGVTGRPDPARRVRCRRWPLWPRAAGRPCRRRRPRFRPPPSRAGRRQWPPGRGGRRDTAP